MDLAKIESQIGRAIDIGEEGCPPARTVFVGISLGAMLAAYSSNTGRPAGLVLIGAASSLSSAIRTRLQSNGLLAPMAWLPVSRILRRDYRLRNALTGLQDVTVVIFQGTLDQQTTLDSVSAEVAGLSGVTLISVPGATHSSTYSGSLDAQMDAINRILIAPSAETMPATPNL